MLTQADQTQLLVEVLLTYAIAMSYRLGMFSLAPVAFASAGAYSSSLFVIKLHWSFVVATFVAVVACALIGLVISYTLARSAGLTGSIASLCTVIVVQGIVQSLGITGGTLGLIGIPNADERVGLVVAAVIVIAGWWYLDHSQFGRRSDLLVHNSDTALALGVLVTQRKVLAQTVGIAIGAFAGCLSARSLFVVTPDTFSFSEAIKVSAYVVVGGVTYWLGPVLGVAIIGSWIPLINGSTLLANAVSGLLMVVVIVLAPHGLSGVLRHFLRHRRPLSRHRMNKLPPEKPPDSAARLSTPSTVAAAVAPAVDDIGESGLRPQPDHGT